MLNHVSNRFRLNPIKYDIFYENYYDVQNIIAKCDDVERCSEQFQTLAILPKYIAHTPASSYKLN